MDKAINETGAGAGLLCGAYCERLDLRGIFAESGRAEVALPPLATSKNTLGTIHGGALASAALAAAELAAWSSQRSGENVATRLEGRPTDLSIAYLMPAGTETLCVKAAVSARGRSVVHVAVDVVGGDGARVATAQVAYRIAVPGERELMEPELAGSAVDRTIADEGESIRRRSPYVRAMGARLLRSDASIAELAIPLAGNESASGRMHAGAVAGAADTAAAIASRVHLAVENPRKMGTTSMALAFTALAGADVTVAARLLGRESEAFSARIEAASAADGGVVAHGVVSYRFEE